MNILKKIYHLLNSGKSIAYHEDIKKKHSFGKELFTLALRNKKASKFKVQKIKSGLKISLRFTHDLDSNIEYHFKYNRDGLLLLRGGSINNKMIIASDSILDFAISARPLGELCRMEWVPAHGRTKGVSIDIKTEINYNDSSFELYQTFNALNPNVPNRVLWAHSVRHKISIDAPFLEVTNQIKFINDTEIKSLYLTMLPANAKNVDKLYLGNGVLFNQIPSDGTSIKDSGAISSAMYVKENKNSLDYIAAVSTQQEEISQTVVTFRVDNVSKFYINEMSDSVARENEGIHKTQRIVCVTSERL